MNFTIFSLLFIEENIKDTPTAKAVRCFSVFNHDSWPDDKLELLDYSEEEVKFLLEHFSTVLERFVFVLHVSYFC